MSVQNLESILSGVQNLPTLPQVAIRLLELLNDPKSSVKDLNQVMTSDPSLAATILRIVNSSYYGLRHHVSSLTHALNLLGYRVVKNVVLTAAAAGLFRKRNCTACFDPQAFSLHSVASAATCRYLADYSGAVDPETAYSFGLLHDIGKLAMDQCFSTEYFNAVMHARRQHQASYLAEKEICGHTHAEVGEALVTMWKLPGPLCQAIGRHHDAGAVDENSLIAISQVADYACGVKDLGSREVAVRPQLNEQAWHRLSMHGDVLPSLFSALDEQIQRAREMFFATGK
ncbi:MAG TPA: HDOD domain-containing protein [Planctomycetota bacterium]|nr:HDOD domain-containing protein [Planctomycetota bacterium]